MKLWRPSAAKLWVMLITSAAFAVLVTAATRPSFARVPGPGTGVGEGGDGTPFEEPEVVVPVQSRGSGGQPPVPRNGDPNVAIPSGPGWLMFKLLRLLNLGLLR